MIEILIVATGWAIWDLFVFALPKDNGYMSLKTHSGLLKFDFPHHIKILTLGLVAWVNVDRIELLVVCAILAFDIQLIIYTFLKKRITRK